MHNTSYTMATDTMLESWNKGRSSVVDEGRMWFGSLLCVSVCASMLLVYLKGKTFNL